MAIPELLIQLYSLSYPTTSHRVVVVAPLHPTGVLVYELPCEKSGNFELPTTLRF